MPGGYRARIDTIAFFGVIGNKICVQDPERPQITFLAEIGIL